MTAKRKKVKEFYKNLKTGVSELIASGKFQEFLQFQSRFHSYSFSNTMLIFAQMPEATRVAGIKKWNSMGRRVRKGQKGIKIFAPLTQKVENRDTGDEEWVIEGFRVVTVFDISQTEGKPVPELAPDLKGDTCNGRRMYELLLDVSPVPVKFGDTGGAKGYYHLKNREIVLNRNYSGDDLAATLLHEVIHAVVEEGKEKLIGQEEHQKAEIVAEGATYVVGQYFGFVTSVSSFVYVAGWAQGDVDKVIKLGNEIQKTATELIRRIEEVRDKKR